METQASGEKAEVGSARIEGWKNRPPRFEESMRFAIFLYNERLRIQGRSSVVEQRPFKPKVVGSIPPPLPKVPLNPLALLAMTP